MRSSTNKHYYSVGREFYDDDYSDRDDSSVCGLLDFSHPLANLRQDSLKSLRNAYQSLSSGDGQSSNRYKKTVCWIHGLSGTGKSTLFQQFVESLPETTLVLRGKYEERKGGQDAHPLSALLEAYATLGSNNVITDEERQALRQHLAQSLGQDGISSISTVIPKLGRLLAEPKHDDNLHSNQQSSQAMFTSQGSLGNVSNVSTNSQSSQYTSSTTTLYKKNNTEMAGSRLKYMFQALTKAITSLRPGQPTIIHLDDVQWSMRWGLEVLEVLLLDQEIPALMFVGCCRSDAVTQDLLETMETIHNAADASHLLVKNLEVRNLSMKGVEDYLKGIFRIDPSSEDTDALNRIQEFATVLHNKAAGNILFIQQILAELNTKGSLTFSHITFQWEWDLEQIPVADTVLQAVTDRIKNNSSPLQVTILKTAAYMRHSFDVDSLLEVMQMDDSDNAQQLTRDAVKAELDRAVEKELLANGSSGSITASTRNIYCFAHDRIQQAVFDMVAEGPTRKRFRQSMGTRLYKIWSQQSEHDYSCKEWMLYAAVDHFNATSPFDKGDSESNDSDATDYLFLATINFKAGEKCLDVAAFENACNYLEMAVKSLGALSEPSWSAHYDLTLDIHVTAAEVELVKGNMEQGKAFVDAVAENARTLEDKFPAQLALAKALGRTRSHDAAFSMTRQALQDAGVYAKSSLGIKLGMGRDLLYVRRYFRTHTDEDILSLPVLDDKRLITLMELYRTTSYHSYWCGNIVECMATALKSIRITLREGLLPPSGTSFMAYFMMLDSAGDKNASRFANLGLQICSRTDQSKFCLQYFLKTSILDSWSTDTRMVKAQYDEAYRRGLAVGDLYNALVALNNGVTHQYTAGYPLAMLGLQYDDILKKIDLYHLDSLKHVVKGDQITVKYLRGTAGTPLDIEAMLLSSLEDIEEAPVRSVYTLAYLQLAIYFGHHDVLAKILDRDSKLNKAHCTLGIRLSFTAVACAILYQKTGQRGHIKKGKACLSELKDASLTRGKNSWHRYAMARAHIKAHTKWRRSDPIAALEEYENAIQLSAERNHKQDVGLTAQLAAEYLLWAADGDKYAFEKYGDHARKYMRLAIQSYSDWGASALVRHLEGKHESLLGDKITAATIRQEYPLE